jgi:hypothetical protein
VFISSYYSSAIAEQLIVGRIEIGSAYVTKYQYFYHRIQIDNIEQDCLSIFYVDFGTRKKIQRNQCQFRYLLNHFAELPCMAIACRLDGIRFSFNNDLQRSISIGEYVHKLCDNGPLMIERTNKIDEYLIVRILDQNRNCLNDVLVDRRYAVRFTWQCLLIETCSIFKFYRARRKGLERTMKDIPCFVLLDQIIRLFVYIVD